MKKLNTVLFLKIMITAVLCLSIFSCAKREVLKREILPYEGPISVDILKQSVGFGNVASIKAFADVTVSRGNERQGSVNGIFAYKAPGKVRINLFGPFGLTATEVLFSDELVQLFVPSQNILYEGNVPGISFGGAMNGNFVYEVLEEPEGYILIGRSPQSDSPVSAAYYFDREYLLNRIISISRDGSGLLETAFSDFNGRVPERMRLSFSNGLSLDFKLKEPEFDSDIPDAYFMSIEPAGKEVKSFNEVFQIFAPVKN